MPRKTKSSGDCTANREKRRVRNFGKLLPADLSAAVDDPVPDRFRRDEAVASHRSYNASVGNMQFGENSVLPLVINGLLHAGRLFEGK